MFRKAGILVAAAFFLTAVVGLGQDNRWDLNVSAAAVLSKKSVGNGVVQTPTNARGILATLRLRFSPQSSMEVTYGRTNNSQKYTTSALDYRIQADVTEFSGAYVFSPFETEKLEPFFLAGAGALVFNPYDSFIESIRVPGVGVRQTAVAFLYGGGVNYHLRWLPSRFALRLQYRGLVYQAPDFKVRVLFTGSRGHIAEPSAGIVFRF